MRKHPEQLRALIEKHHSNLTFAARELGMPTETLCDWIERAEREHPEPKRIGLARKTPPGVPAARPHRDLPL